MIDPKIKVEAVRIQPSALRLMEGREKAPKWTDETSLPGGGSLGWFWRNCKIKRKCGRSPYDRLLENPTLRAAYRIQ